MSFLFFVIMKANLAKAFEQHHYIFWGFIAIATTILIWWIIFPHRSCYKELKDKGYADQLKKKVIALKLINSVILFKYNRAKSPKDFENDLAWLSEIYGEHFVAVKEKRWLKYLGLNPWVKLVALDFPQELTIESSKEKDRVYFAQNCFRKNVTINLKEIGLLLATGRSGSGKSVFAKSLIAHFQKWKMRSIIATPKIFDFPDIAVIDTENSLDELESKLNDVMAIVSERKELLIKEKKTHASSLSENNDYILIVIDEAHQILSQGKDPQKIKIQQIVNQLCRTGRAYGVITHLLTQKLTKGELGEINLRDGYIISGRQDTAEASIAAFGTDIATNDFLKNGVMVFRNFDKTQIVKVALWTK